MDRRLIDYLPPVLREIKEFKAINRVMQPEIEAAWAVLARLMDNQFLSTADEVGIARWEKELHILPKDTDTPETRKARIKAVWNRELPYSFRWLGNWLTGLCGAEGHSVCVDGYTIDVKLDYNALPRANELAREILEMLGEVRPANMLMRLTAALQSSGFITHGALVEMSRTVEIYPKIVNNLKVTADLAAVCISELNRTIEIFPITEVRNE